ncbi:hypothetical protein [Paenibacillus nasutitermitis]|uniref:Uncharacterized protein n=1 Tax=Paenibacillus nasutitermitis TaxID=1652958 RepID=A0A916YT02_9BACL|nr:hypothetical protein [Paenibacillus nasutitermitis]GGD58577.1 hypothetical protein GCM10010911_15490 [Paenibacillus nasutitermitis]
MSTKTAVVERQTAQEGKSLFLAMHIASWVALCAGVVLCLVNISHFSDSNMLLMLGIGFLVGSVFTYTIGTAMNLVHKRKSETENDY